MGYGEEIARVTIGSMVYVVHENPHLKGSHDIHTVNGTNPFRFFGTFNDPKYLEEDKLGEFIRNALRLRTGIPG